MDCCIGEIIILLQKIRIWIGPIFFYGIKSCRKFNSTNSFATTASFLYKYNQEYDSVAILIYLWFRSCFDLYSCKLIPFSCSIYIYIYIDLKFWSPIILGGLCGRTCGTALGTPLAPCMYLKRFYIFNCHFMWIWLHLWFLMFQFS